MGPCCHVFARCTLTDERLDEIAAYLSKVTRPQIKQGRARRWSIWVVGRPEVENTESVLCNCEDELLELGLLPGDAPFRIVLCAGCNAFEDKELLRRLSADLALIANGIATEPTK